MCISATSGTPTRELQAAGLDAAVLEVFVQYRRPLRFDDEVDIHLVAGVGDPDNVPDGLPADRR